MPELEEKVVMGLVKKLGMEKEKVEEAHIAFLDKHPEGQMTRFDTFLAALAALGLPWSLTYWLLHSLCWIQSLPAFLTKPETSQNWGGTKSLQNWWGHEKTWTAQQKDNDKDKYKDNDKYI